jgi:carbamoyltransferase
MGLAPNGKEKYAQKALDVFKSTLYVDGIDFKWKTKPSDSYFWFKERLEGVRFDNIAWALQTWVEDLLLDWFRNAIRKFGIKKIVVSGGVAMNIKAMGKIADLPEVEEMFIGGSGSDESMAISSGICLAEDLVVKKGDQWNASTVKDLPHLYLGPQATLMKEKEIVESIKDRNYHITEEPGSSYVAELLLKGKTLARCAGRMEFGQRALGNRSILADPINLRVKENINKAIKNRDFWMPFAPIIMDKYVDVYLVNPKRISSPHMTIGFETTDLGYESTAAACHPADRTARPQMLRREINPDLYEIMEEFERLSGRGALLNTSFNLHGHPIVNTPQEAFDVLDKSGLDGLLLNNYLIMKKDTP